MKNSIQRKQATTKLQSHSMAREAVDVTVLTTAQTAQVSGGLQVIGVKVTPPPRAKIN